MPTDTSVRVTTEPPVAADVVALLAEHLDEMRATSPPESVHALDLDRLRAEDIVFATARDADGSLLGCGALKLHDDALAEIKSMRTPPAGRRRGVATSVLLFLLDEARTRAIARVSLETGVEDHFAPARRLYARHGFTPCGPFADYTDDPLSVYLTRTL